MPYFKGGAARKQSENPGLFCQRHNNGNIVLASVGVGLVNKFFNGGVQLLLPGQSGIGDEVVYDKDNVLVAYFAVETVRAEQKNVVSGDFVVIDVHFHILLETDGSNQDVFLRISSGPFPVVETHI